jgi:7-cyano-7-deazaguanine reductase
MKDLPLGKRTAVPEVYDPGILYPIPRRDLQEGMHGFDLWRCYELTWLDGTGKPQAAVLEVVYPVESRNIVESKSLKLYLGSLSNTPFSTPEEVRKAISNDLGKLLEAPWVEVRILDLSHAWEQALPGSCIDSIETGIPPGDVNPGLLAVQGGKGGETLFSHLLKTSCPITGQPDWASVLVEYRGPVIGPASLLRYLCSYRSHAGFGEECCTRIYRDILAQCRPEELKVVLFYTRRGGIDINPVRSTRRVDADEVRKYRTSRQ